MEERHHHHQIARRSGTNHQRTNKTRLRPQIKKGITFMRQAIGLDRITDLIGNIGLQPALLDVKHLVEHAGDVETQCIHALKRIT